jgi:DNA polymerase
LRTLAIDIETYSSADLKSCGVYKYTEAEDFEILLFGYSMDGGPVKVTDLLIDPLPYEVVIALNNPYVLKTAHNAAFERTCIAKHFGLTLPPEQWECTMAKVAQLGLPLSLDQAAKALGIEDGKKADGKKLIRYFSIPCKPTKTNGMRTRNLPQHDPEKWLSFIEYCAQDVAVELKIKEKTSFFEINETEKKVWKLDQQINDRGILVDPEFVKNAIEFDLAHAEKLTRKAAEISGLENPNSVSQLKEWLLQETGETVQSLNKETIPALLKSVSSEAAKHMLEIRQQLSKTSIKKYAAMMEVIGRDNRVRGIHQYYGANRTGRWAGRLIQPQNMPKNELKDLDLARRIVKLGELDMLEMLFGDVSGTISQLTRTSFIAKPGCRFIIADFSAIEARVIAWLAGEKWRVDLFNKGGKIYEASASQMFKIPIEQITKGSTYRQRGKIAELALGYQGGPNSIQQMEISTKVPPEDRIPEDERVPLVKKWRKANQKIVQFWYDVNDACIEAVDSGERTGVQYGIEFHTHNDCLFLKLPSGRELVYQKPRLKEGQRGPAVTYMGMNQTTKQWQRQDTYGGKLVENIVQATARDLLAHTMLDLAKWGYTIVMHVHDEVVLEEEYDFSRSQEVADIMSIVPTWAKGLPQSAEAYETEFYKKD